MPDHARHARVGNDARREHRVSGREQRAHEEALGPREVEERARRKRHQHGCDRHREHELPEGEPPLRSQELLLDLEAVAEQDHDERHDRDHADEVACRRGLDDLQPPVAEREAGQQGEGDHAALSAASRTRKNSSAVARGSDAAQKLAVRQLRAREAPRLPQLPGGTRRPGSHVEIRLGVRFVARRAARGGALLGLLVADLDRGVEVLRPDLDARRLRLGPRLRSQLLERRRGEAEPIAEEPRGRRIDLERCAIGQVDADRGGRVVNRGDRRPAHLRLAIDHQFRPLDPDLGVGAEEGRSEAAQRPAQPDLPVRSLTGRRDDGRGNQVQSRARGGERRRHGLERLVGP